MSKYSPSYGQVNKDYAKAMFTTAPEDDGPVWMVNLMKYRTEATYADGTKGVTGKEADDRYAPTKILREIGAEIPFFGDVIATPFGDGTQWDRVGVVKYPTRRSFLEMQNRQDFQKKHEHKNAGMEFTFVIGCQPVSPQPALRPDTSLWSSLEPTPSDDDGPIMVVHVIRYEEGGRDTHMEQYQSTAARPTANIGGGAAAWFNVEGTIMGDGRSWDEVRFNAFPSMKLFMSEVVNDPQRHEAQTEPRERAIADTYTLIVRPTIDTFTTQGPI
jgi:hypothetical protein